MFKKKLLLNDRQVGSQQNASIEATARRRDSQAFDQIGDAARWPTADNRKRDAGLSKRGHCKTAAFGQHFLVGEQGAIDIGENGGNL